MMKHLNAKMDIIPGYWITPWFAKGWFYEEICFGAIAVVLEGLLGFSDKDSPKNTSGTSAHRFSSPMPAIDLLESYNQQVARMRVVTDRDRDYHMCELMLLDSWLSLAGRQKEIVSGQSNLLKRTAPLIQHLADAFHLDFGALEWGGNEDGLQQIQEVSANYMDALGGAMLTEAEQVFLLVAMLRTAKHKR
ncbi:hypothetical protein BGZ57DRAFT_854911 [Hyaloscypha finlandica]|nr:hypothetical protein BGZ57DRAFT_854911 [Hyaloscypha finlandica]